MIDALATIISHFLWQANCAWCLALIVNLVVKIILQQFDSPQKARKPDNKDTAAPMDSNDQDSNDQDGDDNELLMDAEKEGWEMNNGKCENNFENNEYLAQDVENIEQVMDDEVRKVARQAKPVRWVLAKVSRLLLWLPLIDNLPCTYLNSSMHINSFMHLNSSMTLSCPSYLGPPAFTLVLLHDTILWHHPHHSFLPSSTWSPVTSTLILYLSYLLYNTILSCSQLQKLAYAMKIQPQSSCLTGRKS